MTDVYFVRHCEALGNVLHVFQGQIDLGVTKLGFEQLNCLKKRFEGIKLDKIYASPLERAYQTALAIKGDSDTPIEIEQGIIEHGCGEHEGKSFADEFIKYPELGAAWNSHPEDFAPIGGETMREVYDRSYKAVQKIVCENDGKTVALATHGGIIRCLMAKLLYDDITHLNDIPWSGNTGVYLIRFDKDMTHEIVFTNDTAHLPESCINKSSQLSEFLKGK